METSCEVIAVEMIEDTVRLVGVLSGMAEANTTAGCKQRSHSRSYNYYGYIIIMEYNFSITSQMNTSSAHSGDCIS